MALDDTGLLVKLEANINKWGKNFNRAITQQQRAAKRMEQIARQNANKVASEYEGIGGRIGKAFNGIPASLKGIGGAFLGGLAGGVAVGGLDQIKNSIAATTKEVANLKNEASRAGISTTVFQEWKFLADQNRIGVYALTDGFKELHIRAGEFFLDGTGAGAAAFKKLGYSAEELKTKLKDPSALMTEILGKLKNFDQAGRSFLLEEIFGGAGGEQFSALIGQGEEALNATIARAHEVGAVLDSEMIDKAAEIDRRFGELTARVNSFGKRVVISFADAAIEAADLRAKLDEIFANEGEGRAVLGDEIYNALDNNRDIVDRNAEALKRLDAAYMQLSEEAATAGNAMRGAIGQLDSWGYSDAADSLRTLSAELDAAQDGFRDGTLSGDDFAAKLAEIERGAQDAFASLSDVDRTQFSGVMSQLSRLGGVIASVAAQAAALVGELAKVAGVDADSKRLDAMRQRQDAEAAGMASLDAMREATDRFNASEAERNSLTTEGVKLERAREDARKRAADSGVTLTDAEITSAAQAALAGDAARAAADKAGRAGGGGDGKGGAGGGSAKLDEFAREAEAIKRRTLALQTEASVLATVALSGKQYGDAMAFAETKARLLTAAQEAGKTVTPELERQIDALAKSYADAGQKAEAASRQMQDADGATEKGANALADLFSAGMDGSEAFGNALRNLAAELLKSQVLKLIMSFAASGMPGSGFVGALSKGLSGGFSEGGFTGGGGKFEPAGIVHRGEYVFSAETVKRIGADQLDSLHRSAKSGARGYSGGGLVGSTAKINRASSDPPRVPTGNTQNITLSPQITLNASGGTAEQNADLARRVSEGTERAMRGLIRDELVRQMRPGSMLSG